MAGSAWGQKNPDDVQFYERFGAIFKMTPTKEERYDRESGEWVNVGARISDLLFGADTDLNEITPEEAALFTV